MAFVAWHISPPTLQLQLGIGEMRINFTLIALFHYDYNSLVSHNSYETVAPCPDQHSQVH